jgi:hypothetical protein
MWWKVSPDGEKTEVTVISATDEHITIQCKVRNGALAERQVPRENDQHRYCESEAEVKAYRRKCLLKKIGLLEEKRNKLFGQVKEVEAKIVRLKAEAEAAK